MKLSADEREALLELSRTPMREESVHARLIGLELVRRGKGRPWGAFVAVTKAGRAQLDTNTGMKPVSGLTGLAANRKPTAAKRGHISTQPRVNSPTKGGSDPSSPLSSRVAAPLKRRRT